MWFDSENRSRQRKYAIERQNSELITLHHRLLNLPNPSTIERRSWGFLANLFTRIDSLDQIYVLSKGVTSLTTIYGLIDLVKYWSLRLSFASEHSQTTIFHTPPSNTYSTSVTLECRPKLDWTILGGITGRRKNDAPTHTFPVVNVGCNLRKYCWLEFAVTISCHKNNDWGWYQSLSRIWMSESKTDSPGVTYSNQI